MNDDIVFMNNLIDCALCQFRCIDIATITIKKDGNTYIHNQTQYTQRLTADLHISINKKKRKIDFFTNKKEA